MLSLSRKLYRARPVLWCTLFLTCLVLLAIGTAERTYAQGITITHVRLLFDDGRPVYSVEPGGVVQAHAVINYRGSGVFEGQWKVNNRLLSRVHKQLNGSRSFSVSTPAVPPLPTEQMGSYRLEFFIHAPKTRINQPVLIYNVIGQIHRE